MEYLEKVDPSSSPSRGNLKGVGGASCFKFLSLRHIPCTLRTNEIPRTGLSVQVDYVRASKSDICAISVVTISEVALGVFGGRTTIFRILRC
jgi:hypothetical protein